MKDPSKNQNSVSRRQFGKIAGAVFGAAAGFHFIPSRAWGRLEKPTLAGIGTGGKGRTDIQQSRESGLRDGGPWSMSSMPRSLVRPKAG